jgi:hypothetical protein
MDRIVSYLEGLIQKLDRIVSQKNDTIRSDPKNTIRSNYADPWGRRD